MVAIIRSVYLIISVFVGSMKEALNEIRTLELKMRSAEILMGCFFFFTLTFILMVNEPC